MSNVDVSSDSSKTSNVKVVVRVRPPNAKELSCGKTNVVKVMDEHMLTFDPKDDDSSNFFVSKPRTSILDKRIRDLHFAFDRVFDDQASNKDVFQHTTRGVLTSILQGYNCSVFAYGATSAGKTHTMLGSTEEPGVIFLTMMELYKRLMEKQDKFDSDISVSYLEIYNETCKDLLLPTGPLAVREDPEKGVCVNGLSLHKPRSAEELLEMLHFGNQNRTQHPTDANKQSSRSHAVFQVFVKQCPKASGLSTSFTVAKMSLIDLAGSERATVTTNRGDRLREGANINKSLLALGNCINALAENKSNLHIPYRNSKLTRLLKDSLGGNCKTIMIAAVSPSTLSYEDTYNTLKYANRAKNIKSNLSVNTMSVDHHISQYTKIVEELKAQVAKLQSQLDAQHTSNSQVCDVNSTHLQTLKRFEGRLALLYKEKYVFKQDLIQCEATERKIHMKLQIKEKEYKLKDDLSFIDGVGNSKEATARMNNIRKTEECKLLQLNEQKLRLQASLEENRHQLSRLHDELNQWANKTDSLIRMQINLMYEAKDNALEKLYLQKQAKYWEKCFKTQVSEMERSERMTNHLLSILKAQQDIIECFKTNKLDEISSTSLTFESAVEELISMFSCGAKVSWADQSCMEDKTTTSNMPPCLTNFSTCTPFKTPSRKPSILRQMVLDSRKNDSIPEKSHSSSTERNTIHNAGPIRSKLLFTDKENLPPNATSNDGTDGSTTPLMKRRQTYVGTDMNATFSLAKKPKRSLSSCSPDIDGMEFEVALTPPSSDSHLLSRIPIPTPLKCLSNSRRGRSHMRSLTDGDQTFTLEENVTMTTDVPDFNSTFSVNKASMSTISKSHNMSQLKRKPVNLGAPSRAFSSLDLRKGKTSHERTRLLKSAQSFSSLSKRSRGNEKERFRF